MSSPADRKCGVVGVGDRVELRRLDPGLGEAVGHRLLGQLPGRERDRGLAVLASREALLLGGGHRAAVDDDRCGGVVEDGVDSEDLHREVASPRSASPQTKRRIPGKQR
jgi:hypothetical protein